MLWLLLEFRYLLVLICDHKAEAARFFPWHRHSGNGDICPIFLVEVQHHFIIHFVNVVSGKDQYILRVVAVDIVQVLVNGISSSCIPFAVVTFLIGRKHCHTAIVTV